MKEENYRGALEYLDKAIEYYPGDHEALANRSVAHYFLGDLDKALADLKSAQRILPENRRYGQFVNQLEKQMKAR